MARKPIYLLSLILFVPSSIILGLYAYLGAYSQLMADDFCSIYYAERFGFLRSIWYWYITWHGGYSASFLDAILGLFGRNGISFVVPVTILFWLSSLVWITGLVLNDSDISLRMLVGISLGSVLLFTTFILSPAMRQSLLWWGTLRAYIPPLIIFTLFIGVYFSFSRGRTNGIALFLLCLASFLIIFINGGFSETFTPVQVVILFLALIWSVIVNKIRPKADGRSRYFFLAAVLGAILSLILMVIAPGNSIRQSFFPPTPSALTIVFIAWKVYMSFWRGILFTAERIAALAGAAIGVFLIGSLFISRSPRKFTDAIIVFLMGLFLVFLCFPPAAYGQSEPPAEHTLVIPTFILVSTILYASFIAGQSSRTNLFRQKALLFLGLNMFALSLIGFSTIMIGQNLVSDIPRAVEYAKEWAVRDELIKDAAAAGQGEVVVPALHNWLYLMEPNDNPRFFVNVCMSYYYDIKVSSPPDEKGQP